MIAATVATSIVAVFFAVKWYLAERRSVDQRVHLLHELLEVKKKLNRETHDHCEALILTAGYLETVLDQDEEIRELKAIIFESAEHRGIN